MTSPTPLETVRRMAPPGLTRVIDAVEACACDVAAADATFATHEALVMAVANEAVRGVLTRLLQARATRYGDAVRVDGAEYVEHAPGTVTYHSLCGPLAITRATYRQTGVHNGPTVVPLELEVGMVAHATPALAKAVALGYAKHDLRSYAEDLAAAHREPPSRATLERLAQGLAAHAHAAAPRIEHQLRRCEPLPAGACGVVLGLDRGAVPMAEVRADDQPPATPRRPRTRPYERTPPAPFDVAWRMAPVATVTITDRDGEALQTRKYAATAAAGWDGIVARALADIDAVRRADPTLQVGVVQDGAHELWNVTRAALARAPTVHVWFEAIDRYHLAERLGEVLRWIEPDDRTRRTTHAAWQLALDTAAGAIDDIEAAILDTVPRLDAPTATALDEHLTYLRNNKDRMRYSLMRGLGLPIGSGATESACNTLLNLRTKRNAEHWSEPGLQGVLTLRGIHQSDRFEAFWQRLAHDYMGHVTPVLRAA